MKEVTGKYSIISFIQSSKRGKANIHRDINKDGKVKLRGKTRENSRFWKGKALQSGRSVQGAY